jgi:hypothetical protein
MSDLDDDANGEAQPAFPPPGMGALLDEYRHLFPALRTGVAPSSVPRKQSKHPLVDTLLEQYRAKGLL